MGTLTNLLMSSLWTTAFKAIKSIFAAKLDVSTPIVLFNFFFVAQFDKSNTTLTLSLRWLFDSGN